MKFAGGVSLPKRIVVCLLVAVLAQLVAIPAPADAVAEPETCPELTDSVERLYEAYFLRAPDAAGYDYWLTQYASGQRDLPGISSFFAESAEFDALYGALTDREFVELIYTNVLRRGADEEGLTYWTGRLATESRGTIMLLFAESPEFVALTMTAPPQAGYYSWPAPGFTFECPPLPELFVITDSVMLGMGPQYRDTIKQVPQRLQDNYRLTFDGKDQKWAEVGGSGCRPISAGAQVMSTYPDRLDGIVIIGLGYNQFNDEEHKPSIDNMVAMAPDAELIVLVTLREDGVFSRRYPRANDYMRSLAANDERIIIADWAAAAGGRDDLTYDGLHLTPLGAQTFADLLVGSISAARPDL